MRGRYLTSRVAAFYTDTPPRVWRGRRASVLLRIAAYSASQGSAERPARRATTERERASIAQAVDLGAYRRRHIRIARPHIRRECDALVSGRRDGGITDDDGARVRQPQHIAQWATEIERRSAWNGHHHEISGQRLPGASQRVQRVSVRCAKQQRTQAGRIQPQDQVIADRR